VTEQHWSVRKVAGKPWNGSIRLRGGNGSGAVDAWREPHPWKRDTTCSACGRRWFLSV